MNPFLAESHKFAEDISMSRCNKNQPKALPPHDFEEDRRNQLLLLDEVPLLYSSASISKAYALLNSKRL